MPLENVLQGQLFKYGVHPFISGEIFAVQGQQNAENRLLQVDDLRIYQGWVIPGGMDLQMDRGNPPKNIFQDPLSQKSRITPGAFFPGGDQREAIEGDTI